MKNPPKIADNFRKFLRPKYKDWTQHEPFERSTCSFVVTIVNF